MFFSISLILISKDGVFSQSFLENLSSTQDGLPSLGSGVLRLGHIVGLHLWHVVCGLGRGGVEFPPLNSSTHPTPKNQSRRPR